MYSFVGHKHAAGSDHLLEMPAFRPTGPAVLISTLVQGPQVIHMHISVGEEALGAE